MAKVYLPTEVAVRGKKVRVVYGGALAFALLLGMMVLPVQASFAAPTSAVPASTVVKTSSAKNKKFVKSIHLQAKKKAALQSGKTLKFKAVKKTGVFKSKNYSWAVHTVTGDYGYETRGKISSKKAVREYRKALISGLVKKKLKKVSSTGKLGNESGRYDFYANKTYSCVVHTSTQKFNLGASINCVSTSAVVKAQKKTAPLVAAYNRNLKAMNSPAKIKDFAYGTAKIAKSSHKKYRAYKKGTSVQMNLQHGISNISSYAKAPGKKWVFVTTAFGRTNCSDLENNKVASRAFAGTKCDYRGKTLRVKAK